MAKIPKSISIWFLQIISFYQSQKLLYLLYQTILQYTQYLISYLCHLFIKTLVSPPLSLSSSSLFLFAIILSFLS